MFVVKISKIYVHFILGSFQNKSLTCLGLGDFY